MRDIPTALAAHLASGATTLCTCWRVTRADGERLGFTDHDLDLGFDGTLFEAAGGFVSSAVESSNDLAPDNQEVVGAFSSDRLTESDLAAGLYDDALVEIWRVNWAAPDQRLLIRKAPIGEVTRSGLSFSAEIRGIAKELERPQGRLYQYGCDAALGDARCGVDTDQSAFRTTASVTAASGNRVLTVSGAGAYEAGWFAGGVAAFTTGANAGRTGEIRAHVPKGASVEIELWQAMVGEVAVSDALTLTAGCDKRFETCKAKFANAANFRGFPFMPGNAFIQYYPTNGGLNDGSVWR